MEGTPFPEIKAQFDNDPLSLCDAVPGIWLVDKPSGPSSNFVVGKMKRHLKLKRVGHAGTLDPLASGLLVIMAGNASRLFDSVQEFPKTYVAEFVLGRKTDTQDSTGTQLGDWQPTRTPPVERGEMEVALQRFSGMIKQLPPMYSALKKNGVPLYKLARRGEEVERTPREVEIYSHRLDCFNGDSGQLTMEVSSGFYVRTLINDIGDILQTGAVMTSLRRTAIGPFLCANAKPLEFFMAGK
jgi:tRNA pseudouridine 55 synthase